MPLPELVQLVTQTPRRMETVLSILLATAKSGTPSPLKSPTVTSIGPRPVAYCTYGWKLPLPLPNRTETVLAPVALFAVTTSILPSPLKSAIYIAEGDVAGPTEVLMGWPNVPVQLPSPRLPRSTETPLALWSTVTRSRQPSLLKSAVKTLYGKSPVG